MKNLLELKTINELKQFSFVIPSYQRGYRWGEKEIYDLLNDISDFQPKEIPNTNDKTWYCLQPIVVKEREGKKYEVIDGQQRLTTIYLILHYLNERYTEENKEKLFSISYETRKELPGFFTELKKNQVVDINIDYYYISNAYNIICKWFNKDNFDKDNFKSKFTFSTKVIWYESYENDPIEIFTRINMGKIPLTNSELIKALFLNSSNFNDSEKIRLKQLEIASEWDRIELNLQNDMLWYFINKETKQDNRIEYIFDLMNRESTENDEYATFRFFSKKFYNKNESLIDDNWKEVKDYYQRFLEWFNERELYHKIGFLIAEGDNINSIINESQGLKKDEFKQHLDKKIRNHFSKVDLAELQYGDKKVKSVLLLYNILAMLNNKHDHSHFPFKSYKEGKWDIEHITSVKDKSNMAASQEINWLNDALEFIQDSSLKEEVEKYLINNAHKEFTEIYEKVIEHFNKELRDNDIDDISNLTLLDYATNRGYKNAVFPVKRSTIIKKEKEGQFIPLCTKNAFLKYFSEYPPKMSFWTQDDRENYFKDIERILHNYVPNSSAGGENE